MKPKSSLALSAVALALASASPEAITEAVLNPMVVAGDSWIVSQTTTLKGLTLESEAAVAAPAGPRTLSQGVLSGARVCSNRQNSNGIVVAGGRYTVPAPRRTWPGSKAELQPELTAAEQQAIKPGYWAAESNQKAPARNRRFSRAPTRCRHSTGLKSPASSSAWSNPPGR